MKLEKPSSGPGHQVALRKVKQVAINLWKGFMHWLNLV